MSDAPHGPDGAASDARAPLADAEARARIRHALDETIVVEAAAGTGKTSELVLRILGVIGAGKGRLSTIAAVTFTEKAAGEMKLRLRGALEDARRQAGDDQARRARFEEALSELEAARISTIHGFCGDLLRERPIEARVDPRFAVEGEQGAVPLLQQAFDAFVQGVLHDPPPGIRRALRRGDARRGALSMLRSAAATLVEIRDFDAPWESPEVDREAALDAAFEQLRSLGALGRLCDRPRDTLARDLRVIADFVDERLALEAAREARDYDELEWALRGLLGRYIWKRRGSGEHFAPGVLRADVVSRRDAVAAGLGALLDTLEAQLASQLREELRPVIAAYETRKAQVGTLDYLDLLIRTRDLLRDDGVTRRELQARFSHLFVDEFQDTDPLQAEILLWLCARPDFDGRVEVSGDALPPVVPGKLFVVGDPKQAIYRFRRADVMLYERVKRGLHAQGGQVVQLTTSFRAVPAIQSAVNAAFSVHMRGSDDGSQAQYQPLQPHRAAIPGQPAVIALPVPEPYSPWGRLTKGAVEASLPDAVGAFVDYLTRHSGLRVSERGRDDVPLSARHVCLLFRRFRSYAGETTRDYVRALEARQIPHVLVGGRSFHAREEVAALRTALTAIEWPNDALSVYATLRGPLISLSDAQLLDFSHHVGRLSPLRDHASLELSDARAEVADALSLIGRLHRMRNRRPAGETIHALLDATRAHAGIAIWPTGEQALANVLRIGELANSFERRGATSFRAFVQHLQDDAEQQEAREAPVVEEGTEGVRMMTVHTAKGLEFPVVILCEPTAPRQGRWPSRYLEPTHRLWVNQLAGCIPLQLHRHRDDVVRHDEDEELRIGYVAATRARDLLVVPCVGDGPMSGWVDPLHRALYPAPGRTRDAAPVPGGPRFGDDSVLRAPVSARRSADDSVAPGLHRSATGTHEVVWWDPRALDLGRQTHGGLRQDRLLTADAQGTRAADGEAAHDRWQARRARALKTGGAAAIRPRPVTTWAAERPAATAELLWTTAPREGRPAGARFGTLVHAVLADSGFRADDAWLQALARGHARALGAPPAEAQAAAEAVEHALRHDLLQRAARSPDARFEHDISLLLGDGEIAEGSIDLCFVEPDAGARGQWVVIDFKTDTTPDAGGSYASQLAMYVAALERGTGLPARGFLLAV